MTERKKASEKLISLILYSLPVLFLAACYFLMTVTGEDLWQGAGLKHGFIQRAIEAFKYSSRLSDMYAWSVIGAFDYRFSFGIDTLFRAFDVLMGLGIIYIISYIGLGRRLSKSIGDALVFNAVFCAIFLNKNCEALYVAFSNIHNYLLIGILSMIFFIPFARKAQGLSNPNNLGFKLCMTISGFLFGFSSNVTPVVFLITFIICFASWLIISAYNKNSINFKELVISWEAFAVLGIILACVIMYGFGNGFSVYISEEYINATDYISLENIFSNPDIYIPKILNHIYENFCEIFPCIILLLTALIAEATVYKTEKHDNSDITSGFKFICYCTVFVIIHTLAMSQVNITSLIRLVMPAYFVTVSAISFCLLRFLKRIEIKKSIIYICSLSLIIISTSMTYDITTHRYEYNRRIANVIQEIRMTPNDFYYIPYSMIHIEDSDIYGFTQYKFLHEWMAGNVKVCNKTAFIDYNN